MSSCHLTSCLVCPFLLHSMRASYLKPLDSQYFGWRDRCLDDSLLSADRAVQHLEKPFSVPENQRERSCSDLDSFNHLLNHIMMLNLERDTIHLLRIQSDVALVLVKSCQVMSVMSAPVICSGLPHSHHPQRPISCLV